MTIPTTAYALLGLLSFDRELVASQALADGLIRGPRFFYAGRFLSMTGGHGDFRQLHEHERSC